MYWTCMQYRSATDYKRDEDVVLDTTVGKNLKSATGGQLTALETDMIFDAGDGTQKRCCIYDDDEGCCYYDDDVCRMSSLDQY